LRSALSTALPGFDTHDRRSGRRVALIVAAVFTGVGVAWVLLTDILLYLFARDPVLVGRIETAKGWTFVALAAVLVYTVTLRAASHVSRTVALLSRVLESIADGLLLLGPDRTILHANRAALKMLECERLEDLVGLGAAEFSRRFRVSYADGSLVPPAHFVSQRVFDEAGPLEYKATLHTVRDRELIVSVTAAGVREEPERPADCAVSVMHDITDAENLDRMRNGLFAAAAHSFKTPVAIIKANARVLSREAAPPCRRSAEAVERQCDRIDRLIQNLLLLARVRSGTLQLFPQVVELSQLVDKLARELSRPWSRREVCTEILHASRVHADEERLAMALRSMAADAIRCSLPATRLTLVLTQHDADAHIGFRYRARSPEERISLAGAGDELKLDRRVTSLIARAHGGKLWEDTVGAETTVWMGLPAIVGSAP